MSNSICFINYTIYEEMPRYIIITKRNELNHVDCDHVIRKD